MPIELIRKSVFFTQTSWQDLQDLMKSLGADTPSLAIAALVSNHKNKGAENACPTRFHSNR